MSSSGKTKVTIASRYPIGGITIEIQGGPAIWLNNDQATHILRMLLGGKPFTFHFNTPLIKEKE